MNAIGTLVSFILLWVLIYFLAIMPRRRKMKQHRQMIADLRLNDEVLTSGGIRGRVVRRTDALITVEVAPNVTFDLAPDKIESVVEREVRASQRTCARCGAPLDPTDRFCRKCSATAGGAGLPPPPLLRGRPAESRLPATQSRGPSAAPSPLPARRQGGFPSAAAGPGRSPFAAAALALIKSLLLAAVVIVASLLLALANPAAGILALLAGSALLMLRSYRKEWPVSRLTCLMPPLSAVLCLGVQLAALPAVSSAPLVSGAIVLGLFLGFLAGKGHRVFARDGRVFARRTFLYLLIWMVCLLVAQGGGLWQNESATGWGLGVSFFSSAMIIALSAVLFGKYRTQRRSLQAAQAPVAKLAIVLAVLAFFGASTSFANLPAGTYEGPLDPEGLAILKSRYQIDVSSSAAAVQIQSDGSAILLHEVVFEIQGSTKYVFSPLAASAPGVWGMGRCRVTESYPDGRRPAEEAKEENFHLDESPQSDGAYLLWLPNVVMVPLEFGSGMDMRGREFPWRVHLVGAMPGGSGSAAGSRIGAIPTSPEELVGQIRQRLQASGISEDAVKAGVVAALLLLLAGASTSVAQSLALAVAAQTQDRIRPPGEPTYSGDGRILSGQQARDWLAGRNLCRDGQLTDDFWRGWHDQPWSRQDAPHPFGLQAIAGNWRRDQPLGDDVTIIIDNPVPPEPLPELPPPLVNAD